MKTWSRRFISAAVALTIVLGQCLPVRAENSCSNLFAFDSGYTQLRNSTSWWTRNNLYFQHIKVLKKFAQDLESMDEAQNPELSSPKFHEILKKIILNPKTVLGKSELEFISANKNYKYITQNLLLLFSAAEFQLRIVQRFSQYWEGRGSHPEFLYEKGWKKKALSLIRSIYNGPLRFFTPLPTSPRIKSPTTLIFDELYKNPHFKPTPEQLDTLVKSKALENFKQKQRFVQERLTWTSIRKWIGRAFIGAMLFSSALTVNYSLQLSEAGSFVPAKTFFEDSSYRLEPTQVRIYNESVPFPHMAIEIDGKVYSYGQTHMSVQSTREYLLSQDIQALMEKHEPAKTDKTYLEKSLNVTGLDKLPRSVQMITLNLDMTAKNHLKRKLELSSGVQYRNITLAMDCATMVVLALKDSTNMPIPEIIDASPSQVMMWLAALKTVGSRNNQNEPLVANVMQVAMAETERPNMHLFRNLYINFMEAKFFWNFAPITYAQRGYLEVRYGKDNFQYLNPEVRAEVLSWHKDVEADMAKGEIGLEFSFFLERATDLAKTPQSERDANWQKKQKLLLDNFRYVLDNERNSTLLKVKSPDTAFMDLIRSTYALSVLNAWEITVNETLTGVKSTIVAQSASEALDTILTELK